MSKGENILLNEHVVEIRYKANPVVLDHRGTWAEKISNHMNFSKWKIDENRIDISSHDQDMHVFVGYQNAGISAFNTPNKNYFPEKSVKFLSYIFKLDEFFNSLLVKRIGVRSRFCTPFAGTFDELLDLYTKKFLKLTENARDAIGNNCKLVDIGGPLNYKDKYGYFNTMSGPVAEAQMYQIFKKIDKCPEVGLYFDIDYFILPDDIVIGKDILSKIKIFYDEAWNRNNRICELIIG